MPATHNFEWDTKDILGSGGFGNVYKGKSKSDSATYVAIKTFICTTKFYREREAETMLMANNENIVKCIGMERDEKNAQVLIMEYCSAGNLSSFISLHENGLPTNDFLHFFDDFLSALKHLNDKHIVHRDIKPDNILMSIHNEQRIYKIADFGAARVLQPNAKYGSVYGTPEYVNPDILPHFYDLIEKRLLVRRFNEIHELWSIGVTIYEAATGELPFEPKNGRADAKKLYDMTKSKLHGRIAAKEVENGQVQWMTELPDSCALEGDIKQNVTALLTGLLESNEENMWSKPVFFKEAAKVTASRTPTTQTQKRKLLKPANQTVCKRHKEGQNTEDVKWCREGQTKHRLVRKI